MQLACMGPAPSYRLLQSLFLPPLPSPSVACLTARRVSGCASIPGASRPVELCRRSWSPGYLPRSGRGGILRVRCESGFCVGFGRGAVSDSRTDRSGFVVVRNSRNSPVWLAAAGLKLVVILLQPLQALQRGALMSLSRRASLRGGRHLRGEVRALLVMLLLLSYFLIKIQVSFPSSLHFPTVFYTEVIDLEIFHFEVFLTIMNLLDSLCMQIILVLLF